MNYAAKHYSEEFLSKFRVDPVSALESQGVSLSEQEKQWLRKEQPTFMKMSDKQLSDRISKRGFRIWF